METNAQFCERNEIFIEACRLGGIRRTTRQASKFRRGFGSAFRYFREAANNIADKVVKKCSDV